ncbi:hypothetical protein CBR_g45712 [Chara braunii]|uniref:Uncharacterized protein n=1 Tax=Chara braunii TaxID=69332 RepID=A0A388K3N8_CHABU|nr:hypothetical protein CBR_g45712 [Chara braunii]|eukprot:GBG64657.1 hypothetical protein CBR_g45712 [Chara braunii]
MDGALLNEARTAAQAWGKAASQPRQDRRRRKPAKWGGRYRRNVVWAGRGDDLMQADKPQWLFGDERKRKAEQVPEQGRGLKMASTSQEVVAGGDLRGKGPEGKEPGKGEREDRTVEQFESTEGKRVGDERGECSRQEVGQEKMTGQANRRWEEKEGGGHHNERGGEGGAGGKEEGDAGDRKVKTVELGRSLTKGTKMEEGGEGESVSAGAQMGEIEKVDKGKPGAKRQHRKMKERRRMKV